MEHQIPDSKTYRNGKHRKIIPADWTFSQCIEEDINRGSYRVCKHEDDLLEEKWDAIKKLWLGLGWLDLETKKK